MQSKNGNKPKTHNYLTLPVAEASSDPRLAATTAWEQAVM